MCVTALLPSHPSWSGTVAWLSVRRGEARSEARTRSRGARSTMWPQATLNEYRKFSRHTCRAGVPAAWATFVV